MWPAVAEGPSDQDGAEKSYSVQNENGLNTEMIYVQTQRRSADFYISYENMVDAKERNTSH